MTIEIYIVLALSIYILFMSIIYSVMAALQDTHEYDLMMLVCAVFWPLYASYMMVLAVPVAVYVFMKSVFFRSKAVEAHRISLATAHMLFVKSGGNLRWSDLPDDIKSEAAYWWECGAHKKAEPLSDGDKG